MADTVVNLLMVTVSSWRLDWVTRYESSEQLLKVLISDFHIGKRMKVLIVFRQTGILAQDRFVFA